MNAVMTPILVTCAVAPRTVSQTKLANHSLRLRATLDAIDWWIKNGYAGNLVVCDSTGYDLQPCLTDLTNKYGISNCIEVLKFHGDSESIQHFGKGYGEGETIDFALKYSNRLQDSRIFAKITGKLWVENFRACNLSFNGLHAFDVKMRATPRWVDTRFYIISREKYNELLRTAHFNVREADGVYLEHLFGRALRAVPLHRILLGSMPLIRGISGSSGEPYKSNPLKILASNARAKIIRTFKI